MVFKRLSDLVEDGPWYPIKRNYTEPVVPTGIKALDEIMDGFRPGKLYAIGGRPGMGKTSLMLQMALSIAKNREHPKAVYIYSLEESGEDLAERLSSLIYYSVINGILADGNEEKGADPLAEGKRMISSLPIYICDDIGYTANDFCEFCSEIHDGIVFVDYFQRLSCSPFLNDDAKSRELANGLILRMLSNTAKLYDISIILLSQLPREVEGRHDKRPLDTDLRFADSPTWFDEVIMLYRDRYYNRFSEDDTVELTVFRKGEKIGTGECVWDGSKRMFT